MALDENIRILSGVRLFGGFTSEQLRLLAFGAETVRLPAGSRLYLEDEHADSAYVVVRGTIRLFREHDGHNIEVSVAEAGSVLGEMALIADTRRMTSAEAATDSELLHIGSPMFRRILEDYPEAAEKLRAQIVDDLQALIRRIELVGDRLG